MKRGVIASASASVETSPGIFSFSQNINAEQVRYYALYWDEIVIPSNNLIYWGVPDEDVLIPSGVITRPHVTFEGKFDSKLINDASNTAQSMVAAKKINAEPTTDWVIHQVGPALSLPEQFEIDSKIVRVNLVNSLPVPLAETSIYDILDFKSRRADQLAELHSYLDELYVEILSNPDPNLATRKIVDRLTIALKDINQVANEQWKVTKKFDFSAEININASNVAMSAASAAAAFTLYGSSPAVISMASLAGGVASLVKVTAKISRTFEPAKGNLKLSYLAAAQGESLLSA